MLDDGVEFVAVHHQQPPTVHGFMDYVGGDTHAAEHASDVVAEHFVVIARYEDHLGAARRLLHHRLQHALVLRRPVPAVAQVPEIDHVSDQVKILRLGVLQKIEQVLGLAGARAEMHVGNPYGPEVQGSHLRVSLRFSRQDYA